MDHSRSSVASASLKLDGEGEALTLLRGLPLAVSSLEKILSADREEQPWGWRILTSLNIAFPKNSFARGRHET